MSQTATAAADSTAQPGALARHHFLLRRLHSLSGIIPVGVFVCFHLFTNFQLTPLLFGQESTFQHEVNFIHDLPALLVLEVFGIWLPLAFHGLLGLVYTFSGRPNATTYTWADNWRYTFQRISGLIAFIFIFLHVATLRWRWDIFGWYTPFYGEVYLPDGSTVELATATTAVALQSAWWVLALYVVGVFSTVFHFANGLWTAAITWGFTLSVRGQKQWGYVCGAVGIALAVFSAGAIGGAMRYTPTEREQAAIEYAIENPEAAYSGSAIEEAVTGEEEVPRPTPAPDVAR
ncbi:MAG: succinate dehydrogenase [Phycisphaeraceae bacterium]